jgi:thioesterase domain-containing protein
MSSADLDPTVASVAAEIFGDTSGRSRPLPLLKAGPQNPPVFFAHGLGDNVINLLGVARLISLPVSVYGLQAPGIKGVEEPMVRIERLAEYHLAAIRKLQAHGPYFLIGYSLGGLVVMEIAQRLQAMNEPIGVLMMLDSWPARRYLPLGQRTIQLWRAVVRRMHKLAGKSQGQPPEHSAEQPAPVLSAANLQAMQRVKDADHQAWWHYRPRFYAGQIHFVRPSSPIFFPKDPIPVWAHLCSALRVETIPGDHVSMLSAQKDFMAAAVNRALTTAYLSHPGGEPN